jgi:hypothetical protein
MKAWPACLTCYKQGTEWSQSLSEAWFILRPKTCVLLGSSTVSIFPSHKTKPATVFPHSGILTYFQLMMIPQRPAGRPDKSRRSDGSRRPDEFPPCFVDPNGDVIISMFYYPPWDLGTVDMRISSDKLIEISPYFATTLKPEWLHNKVTGNEDCGDGTSRIMKRYELELDTDGSDILVGKVTPLRTQCRTDPD